MRKDSEFRTGQKYDVCRFGRLRSFKGSQKYKIPAGIDLKKSPSVVIWCEQFGVLISPADLNFGA
ncbi:MAG: DM13 domain-containing protein [Alphaproteobacteria bacterium]|nr:DM13 domain-containing protein [Alphaproteobacteria bacterium]